MAERVLERRKSCVAYVSWRWWYVRRPHGQQGVRRYR